jgi:hypothetical protein
MRILVGFKYRLVITIWLYKCENVYIIMVALIDMVVKQGFDHVIQTWKVNCSNLKSEPFSVEK